LEVFLQRVAALVREGAERSFVDGAGHCGKNVERVWIDASEVC
jgi:hypothetical protein